MTINDYLDSGMAGDMNSLSNFVYIARFKGGMNYNQILAFVQKKYPDMGAAEWETKMQDLEAEEMN